MELRGLHNYTKRVPGLYGFLLTPAELRLLQKMRPEKNIRPGEIFAQSPSNHFLFLGVELELCVANSNKAVSTIPNYLNHHILGGFAICKSDSSTGRGGFEVCATPATFNYHKNKWNNFFAYIQPYLTSKPHAEEATLGMHVHVSRKHFTQIQIGKLLLFYNMPENQKFLAKIAGRNENRWAISKPDAKLLDAFKDPVHALNPKRYSTVNTVNEQTLEIRIFDSTTSKKVFFQRLEFVQASCEFIKGIAIGKLQHEYFIGWMKLVRNKKRFPNLAAFLEGDQN